MPNVRIGPIYRVTVENPLPIPPNNIEHVELAATDRLDAYRRVQDARPNAIILDVKMVKW